MQPLSASAVAALRVGVPAVFAAVLARVSMMMVDVMEEAVAATGVVTGLDMGVTTV